MLNSVISRILERLGLAAGGPVWDGGPGAAVLLIDRDGRILEAGDGAPTLFGLPRSLLVGATLSALVEEGNRALVERAMRVGGTAGRAQARLAGKSPLAVELAFRERPDGKRAALVTERHDGVDAQEARALREAADAARRDAKDRADMLADLGHEMRTPLNAVIGFADAMQEKTFGPLGHQKYEEYAKHIRVSGGHLLDLISSILDLAKIDADRFALKRELVDLGVIAAECVGIVRLSAEEAGLKLIARIPDNLPEATLDPRAVRQILLNLLSNAIKFTSDGEISLDVKAHGQDIVITVTDTGVGMSEAELKKLGSRFTAAQGDGVRGAKGAGLGLALAFALAELHGGSMKIKSAPGEGVKATVRLPIKPPAAPARLRSRSAAPAFIPPQTEEAPAILTQLERIEAYRRERQQSAA